MNPMIQFRNPGFLDLPGALTFGVSFKPGLSPIGQFGTGLKYALAVLLRNNHQVTIWDGQALHKAGVRPTIFRGSELSLVTIDEVPTGFTTALGKHWQVWMAYRELHCNSLDENGYGGHPALEPSQPPGETVITVSNLMEVHRERGKFLLLPTTPPISQTPEVDIYPGPSSALFYRGIKVQDWPTPALYTYNVLTHIDLTEDRTVKSSYQLDQILARAIYVAPQRMVARVAQVGDERAEGRMDLNWSHLRDIMPKDTLALLEPLRRAGRVKNPSFKAFLDYTSPIVEAPDKVTLSVVEEEALTKALVFVGSLIGSPLDFPVYVTDKQVGGLLGFIHNGEEIWLTREVFNQGTKRVAGTIWEEYLHLTHHYQDCTRDMQNYLIDKVMSMQEEIQGSVL